MKQGWEIKKLGEIADVEYGFTDKSTEEGDYRYVRITDIDNNGELISTEKKYLKHSKEAEGFLISDNDLLMARTGATFAKVLLYEDFEPSVFASYLIRIKFKEKIENKLYWYFTKTKSYWDQANSLASGAAQPHFNGAAVKQVIFSYPKSLPEQQRIVAILDDAFAAIAKAKANAQQNLQNAKELFESYLQRVFENKGEGWEEKSLEELADEKCTLSYGIVQPGEEYLDGLPIIRPTDLTKRFIDLTGLKRIDPKLADGYKRTKLIGDELLLCVRGTTGTISIATKELAGANVTRGIVPIRFNSKIINQEFGYYLLISNFIQKQIRAKTYGAALMQINIGDLRKIQTAYPPLKTQQAIVQKLDALNAETKKLGSIYQQKINDLEELKKSVLQKAFAGELKTTNEELA